MALLLLSLLLSLILSHPQKPAAADAGMRAAELSALFEVMGSLLEDPTWAQLHSHPCTDTPWPGVQCELIQHNGTQDPFLHVTKLHIGPDLANPPCKPKAHLSSYLLSLPFLKSLSLFSCFLMPSNVSLPPSLFTTSSSLEQLVLKSNPGLSGELPKTLTVLRNLRVLSLSQNNLHGEIPMEIGGLAKLQQLDLSYNHLTGHIPQEVGGLTRLTIFDLSWNRIQGQIPWSVGQLTSLQKLDLSSNLLSDQIPAEFGKLGELVLLDLSHNSITGPIPETLSGLKELQYFLIENNPIQTRIPLFLGSLKKLAVVGLSGCGLLGPIPTCLGSLQGLTALALDRNRLNGSVPSGLGALPRLGQLNLSQNQLSGEIGFGEDFVSRLGKRLDVRDNKGLCTNFQQVSLSLEAPPCLDPSPASGGQPAARGTPPLSYDEQSGVMSCSSSLYPERLVSLCSLMMSVVIFIVTSVLS